MFSIIYSKISLATSFLGLTGKGNFLLSLAIKVTLLVSALKPAHLSRS